MEEQTTWKGHTFTLLVFTGIVVLRSIFFIFGMLVGRAEGQKIAGAGGAAAKNEAKAATVAVGIKPNGLAYNPNRKHLLSAHVGDPASDDGAVNRAAAG